jgi:hypothetical protein
MDWRIETVRNRAVIVRGRLFADAACQQLAIGLRAAPRRTHTHTHTHTHTAPAAAAGLHAYLPLVTLCDGAFCFGVVLILAILRLEACA